MSTYFQQMERLESNERQWEAFGRQHHTVVIAGPGSGKTHVLALKIVKLLREEIVPPKGIACLTYTRLMARELEKRLYEMGVPEDRPNIVVNTVHGFCLNHVVRPFAALFDIGLPLPIRIAPSSIIDLAFATAFQSVTSKQYDNNNYAHRSYRTDFDVYRRQHSDTVAANWGSQEFAQIYQGYVSQLYADKFVDFDSIIENALRLLIEQSLVRQSIFAKFDWLAVDEYQDLGYPLFRIVNTLIDETPIKLFAIGDPNQAIFDFAGTDPRFLRELAAREDMQPTVNLNINYRCRQPIIDIATSIEVPYCEYTASDQEVERSVCRVYEYDAPWKDRNMESTVYRLLNKYEKHGIPLSSIAVFHRWRAAGINKIAQELDRHNMPYILDKTPYYDRSKLLIRWLEDLCYWCLVGWSEANSRDIRFHDLLRTWSRMTDQENLEENVARVELTRTLWRLREDDLLLHEWLLRLSEYLSLDAKLQNYAYEFPDDVQEYRGLLEKCAPRSILSDMRMSDFAQVHEGVNLLTLHSSKGMQFDHVIIPGIEAIEKNANGRRLLYVGITRSRYQVSLLYNTYDFTTKQARMPIYIEELLHIAGDWDFFYHVPL